MHLQRLIHRQRSSVWVSVMWHSRSHRPWSKHCTKQLMSRPQQRDSKVMHRILAMHFCVRRSQRMITKLTDVTSQQMRFLYPTVQRAILQIFRRFSLWTIKLRYVIRFTRFMWIPTLWQAEPALTIRKVRPGVMWSTCLVPQKTISARNCRKRLRILSICASRTTRPARRSQKNSFRYG